MKADLYKTWIFDCDGVILDSNRVKTEAFYDTAVQYGNEAAEALVVYHCKHGGVSRFEKFEYFFRDILEAGDYKEALQESLAQYGELVLERLLTCPEAKGFRPLMGSLREARKIVVTGGMENEVKKVFSARGLARFFEAIYGSPDSKETILKGEFDQGLLKRPSVFVGDSRYDFECADLFKLDFVFVTKYSEMSEWRDFFLEKKVLIVDNLDDLKKQLR